MEQLPALSPVLCIVLLIPTWAADDIKESKRDTSTELTIYRATIALAGVSIIILVTALLLRGRTAASTDTQQQQPAKRHSRAGGNTSEDLHYAEITFKAPAHTEYASIRTQQL
ncbi:transporter [Platysternon megacephalum]|uniref:Transporter n=1 Tax=Platysternon megacephalum TaxID=55544 RepID=A0A4D9DMF3_9SAUR|nr:transporter [Platysternon megacephalum]